MAIKINKDIEDNIFEELENNVSYSVICKKYNVGKATVNRIKNRRDLNLKITKLAKKTIATRRKIQEKQIENNIIKNSELIVFGMIDVIQGVKYAVNNLVEINEDAKTKVDEIIEKLDGLLEDVKNHINNVDVNDKGRDVGKDALIKQIYLTLANISSYYSKQKIRVDAINALKEQMKMFMDYEITAKAMAGIKNLLDDFFYAFNHLKDDEYIKLRNIVIERNGSAEGLFAKHEEGVARPKSGTIDSNKQE